MNTMTKLALGLMGRLRPAPPKGEAATAIALPLQMLSDLLWAAYGVNRAGSGRTAPSALNCQEVDVFVALPQGAYRYDAAANALQLAAAADLRGITGYQDFVDEAPLDLVFVADHARMAMVPVAQRESYASAAAGAIAQNVYLYCAGSGLATVIRAWIDRAAIADALGLTHDQQVLLAQTVGFPKGA